MEIGTRGGIEVVLGAIRGAGAADNDLRGQCSRALRNLSVHAENKARVRALGGVAVLEELHRNAAADEKTKLQSKKALQNLAIEEAPPAPAPTVAAASGGGGSDGAALPPPTAPPPPP